jgi:hypothetical protein
LNPRRKLLSAILSKLILISCLFTTRFLQAHESVQSDSGYTPKDGFVPDENTAIVVAKAVLIPVYGEQSIKNEEPFSAALNNDTWSVHGTMPKGFNKGGVASVEISKTKGCILHMTHGK